MSEKEGHVEIEFGDRVISHHGDSIVTDPSHPPKVTKVIEHHGTEVLHPLSGSSIQKGEKITKTGETWSAERVSQALALGHEALGLRPRTEEEKAALLAEMQERQSLGTVWHPGEEHS